MLLSFVYLESEVKIEWLYREKRELLATEVCWLLVAERGRERERERERGREEGRKGKQREEYRENITSSMLSLECCVVLRQLHDFQKGSSLP